MRTVVLENPWIHCPAEQTTIELVELVDIGAARATKSSTDRSETKVDKSVPSSETGLFFLSPATQMGLTPEPLPYNYLTVPNLDAAHLTLITTERTEL